MPFGLELPAATGASASLMITPADTRGAAAKARRRREAFFIIIECRQMQQRNLFPHCFLLSLLVRNLRTAENEFRSNVFCT